MRVSLGLPRSAESASSRERVDVQRLVVVVRLGGTVPPLGAALGASAEAAAGMLEPHVELKDEVAVAVVALLLLGSPPPVAVVPVVDAAEVSSACPESSTNVMGAAGGTPRSPPLPSPSAA